MLAERRIYGNSCRLSFLVCEMHKEGADKPGMPRCYSHPVNVRLTASEVWSTLRTRRAWRGCQHRARLRGRGGGRGKGGEEGPREAGGRQPTPLLL